MRGGRWAVTAVLFVLSGCASFKPALQATWYFVDDKGPDGNPKTEMYVAILNQGSRTIPVNDIILNPSKDDPEAGWRLKEIDRKLAPGEMLFRPVTIFEQKGQLWKGKETTWECRVPVTVIVVTGPGRCGRLEAETSAPMPTSVPEDWQKNCGK